jgi:hypothetical protein
MKLSKILGLTVVAGVALMAFAGAASATTLETNGVKQISAVTLESTLQGSAELKDTSGIFLNTCSASVLKATTSTASTGPTVSGPVSTFSFTNCTHSPIVVDAKGSLRIERIGITTNGTVTSSGLSLTAPMTVLGSVVTVPCQTSNTDLGTLDGTSIGSASTKITINAILECELLSSVRWVGTYAITGHAIGVAA